MILLFLICQALTPSPTPSPSRTVSVFDVLKFDVHDGYTIACLAGGFTILVAIIILIVVFIRRKCPSQLPCLLC